jgi:hypothetical protein
MKRPSGVARVILAAGVALAAAPALACPVCFSETSKGVLRTYYFTTALLSVLPLLFLGILGTWLHRRSKVLPGAERECSEPTACATMDGQGGVRNPASGGR